MKRLAAAALFAVLMTAAGCARTPVPSPDPNMNQREPRHIPVTPRFTAMKMAAATDGWALAGHRVLVLTDQGQTWRDVTPPDLAVTSPQMVPMQAVFHVEDHWRVWLAVSQHGGPTPGLAVYRTEDGGITWEKSAALPVQGAPGSIDVLNQRNAWLTVGTSLFASRDGGATWEQGGTLPFAGQVDFVREQTGYLAGQEGLQVTRDGGRTWAPVQLPVSELANVRFPVPPVGDVGLVLDERTGLFRTIDAGATWELMSSLRPVSAAAFHTTMEGWVWTDRLLETADGGRTWREHPPDATLRKALQAGGKVQELAATDDRTHLWMRLVNDSNVTTRLRSADRGATWQQAQLPVTELSQVPYEAATLALGGANWTLQHPAGRDPLAIADTQGILWVQYPTLMGDRDFARPVGDYAFMYTPLRPGGGSLAEGARPVLELPGTLEGADLRVSGLGSAGDGRFLVYTYRNKPGAQSGGLAEVRWVNVSDGRTELLVSGRAGGGHFQNVVRSDRWLFWGQSGLVKGGAVVGERAVVFDLTTAEGREVLPPGGAPVMNPVWTPAGKLLFKLEGDDRLREYDPATGQTAILP